MGAMTPIYMPINNFVDNSQIVVIDPMKFYASSDDENNADEESRQTSEPTTIDSGIANGKIDSKLFSADMPEGFRNIYFCQFCEAAFVSPHECQAHETHNHDPMLPHVCNFCTYRASDRPTVIAHIKQLHELDKPYVCVQCHKQFGRRSDLKKHAICHTGIRPFACNVCSKTFSRNTNLRKHMKIHDGLKPFVCQSCPRSFTTSSDLQRHETTHMETKRTFRCDKCPESFVRRDALQQHERKHDERYVNDPENRRTALNVFSETAEYPLLSSALGMPLAQTMATNQSAASMMSTAPDPHIRENVIYPHLVTGDAYSFMPNHPKKVKNPPKALACDKCPKVFTKKSSLLNHKIIHEYTSASECPTCQKIFKTKRELQRHNLIHTGVKKFQCNTCDKRFLRRDKLQRHENVHKSKKLAALPESAFLPENLIKHDSFYSRSQTNQFNASTTTEQQRLQLLEQQTLRPQFYAEYDLTETNNS